MQKLLEAAIECAKVTGGVAMRHFVEHRRSRSLVVQTKGDGSPVSDADRAAEEAARAFITARFPDDGILGEELGEHLPGARRRRCLDPIDGTKTFLRGAPLWGSLVAIVEGERVLAGAAFYPVTNELVAAAPGEGCAADGILTGVSDVAELAEATVLTTDERFPDVAAAASALVAALGHPKMG